MSESDVARAPAVIERLAPSMSALARACMVNVTAIFVKYEIVTPLRMCHFLAQILGETGGLSHPTLVENLNYSAQLLHDTWPTRFVTLESAQRFGVVAHESPEMRREKLKNIAWIVYGGRMGNLTLEDALAYCGHGLIQLTGRDMYARVGRELSLPLVEHPELACDPDHALEIAAHIYVNVKKCNPMADADNCRGVTHAINGGYIGLPAKLKWLGRAKQELM